MVTLTGNACTEARLCSLQNMVSIGTLFVFWVVALAQIWKRSYVPGFTSLRNRIITTVHMVALVGFSLGGCCRTPLAACLLVEAR